MTLADVLRCLEVDAGLTPPQSLEYQSAIRTACRLLNKDPGRVSADPLVLRPQLLGVALTPGDIGRGHWSNVRSRVLRALKRAGIPVEASRSTEPMTPLWQALYDRVTDKRHTCGLSKFLRFCSARDIPPEGVSQETFDLYRQTLENLSFVKRHRRSYQTACRCWNEASVTIEGWPKVTVDVPSWSRRYAYPWERFPEAFRKDVHAFLGRRANQDPFDDDYEKPTRPATLESQKYQIRQVATALAESGFPLTRITGLSVLIKPDNAERALRYLYGQAGKKKTPHLYRRAILLRTIARRWGKPSKKDIEALGKLCRNLGVKNRGGMTQKNRDRLSVFNDPAVVRRLVRLPRQVLARIERTDRGHRSDALQVSLAMAVEFLVSTPVRIKNATEINIEQHLLRRRLGYEDRVHFVLVDDEVKNEEPYEVRLMVETTQLLDIYLKRYHPRLTKKPSPWLFPNKDGKQRRSGNFAAQLSAFILKETGIKMHVHLFRGFAVKVYMQQHPEDYETPRRLLGHTSLETLKAYSDNSTQAAYDRYDQTLAALRTDTHLPDRAPGSDARSPR